MDDLSATINRVLSDPQSVRQLQQAAAALGLSGGGQPEAPSHNPQPRPNSGYARASNTSRRPPAQQQAAQQPELSQSDLADIKRMLEQLTQQSSAPPPPQPAQADSPDIDLSALSGILSGLTGKQEPAYQEPPPQQPAGGGLDLSALSGILGNLSTGQSPPAPASGANSGGGLDLSALSGILGNLGNSPASGQSNGQGAGGGLDLSALSGILGNSGGGQGASQSGGIDLSALSGILGNLGGGQGGAQAQPSGVSALTSMLGGGNDTGGGGLIGSGMDMGMLLKFQQAMSSVSANAGNTRLLLALKGHLKDPERIAKVDDAIKVMQVVQFLPILKESGLFGKLEEVLDGFNLGGLLGGGQGSSGNSGGGLGGLGSLLGLGRR